MWQIDFDNKTFSIDGQPPIPISLEVFAKIGTRQNHYLLCKIQGLEIDGKEAFGLVVRRDGVVEQVVDGEPVEHIRVQSLDLSRLSGPPILIDIDPLTAGTKDPSNIMVIYPGEQVWLLSFSAPRGKTFRIIK